MSFLLEKVLPPTTELGSSVTNVAVDPHGGEGVAPSPAEGKESGVIETCSERQSSGEFVVRSLGIILLGGQFCLQVFKEYPPSLLVVLF